MTQERPDGNPLEQLVDLLVYAPVGLLYDYQEVLPRLVKRGKSQVQLARLLGQMAANQARSAGPARAEAGVADAVNLACSLLARAVTEVGASVGLAPGGSPRGTEHAPEAPAPAPAAASEPRSAPARAEEPTPVQVHDEEPAVLPIARYDNLTAREIIALLDDLSPDQRARIRAHEEATRGRKTVLAKLDQLDA